MKYYSDYTEQYVQDICDALNEFGEQIAFLPEKFETLTYFLQGIVVTLKVFTFLDNRGLVNRGRCPYTGKSIDNSSPKWTYMRSRSLYVSDEGYDIMRKEDSKRTERLMGKPREASQNDIMRKEEDKGHESLMGKPREASQKLNGNNPMLQRVLIFSGRVIILYAVASLISWNIDYYQWNMISEIGFMILVVWTFNSMFF